jgi:hypothetical protein
VTADTSYDWIRTRLRELGTGTLSPDDKARLEQIAQADPFVADALEGYAAVPAADHAAHLDHIASRIRQPHRARRRWLIPNLTVTAIAAVFMILVGTWAVVRWSGRPAEESRVVVLSTDTLEQSGDTSGTIPSIADGMRQDTNPEASREEPAVAATIRAPRSAGSNTTTPPVSKKRPDTAKTAPAIPEHPAEAASRPKAAPPAAAASPIETKTLYAFVDIPDSDKQIRDSIRLFVFPATLQYRLDADDGWTAEVPTSYAHLLVSYAHLGDRIFKVYGRDSIVRFPYPPIGNDPREKKPIYPIPAIPYAEFIDQLSRESHLAFEHDLEKPFHEVSVFFTVGNDGRPSDFTAVTSTMATATYLEEAVRVLESGPGWTCPGTMVPCGGSFTFFFKKQPAD